MRDCKAVAVSVAVGLREALEQGEAVGGANVGVTLPVGETLALGDMLALPVMDAL